MVCFLCSGIKPQKTCHLSLFWGWKKFEQRGAACADHSAEISLRTAEAPRRQNNWFCAGAVTGYNHMAFGCAWCKNEFNGAFFKVSISTASWLKYSAFSLIAHQFQLFLRLM